MRSLKYFILLVCSINLAANLYARDFDGGGFGGGDFRRGGDLANYNVRYYDRHYVDPNYYYWGAANGYYGNPYPDTYTSPPGISDDSDSLYQSYLQSNAGW